MTQTDLAEAIHSSRQAVGKWENGNVDLSTETIAKLCEVFEVSADYLLGLSIHRTGMISDADAAFLAAYHAAPESVRSGIDALLQPYKEQETSSASHAEQGGA